MINSNVRFCLRKSRIDVTRITPSVTKGHTRNFIKRNGDHKGIGRDRSSRGSDDAVKTRAEAKYDGSKSVFESMIRDQERHADSLEAQLHAIKEMGIANYLAQQIDKGEVIRAFRLLWFLITST